MKYIKFLTIVAFSSVISLLHATSVSSPIFGTYAVDCPANTDTYIGISITREPVFTGKVQSIQSGTTNIVAQGEPNWQSNQFVYVAGSQTNHYYLKFTSGELEGAWYDIKSNGAYYTEIEIGSNELAKVAVGDSFEIIPHWTLGTLFPNGGGLTAAPSLFTVLTKATSIHLYVYYDQTDGWQYPKGNNNQPSKTYYCTTRSSVTGWYTRSGTNSSDVVIAPNSFIKVRQPTTSSATSSYSGVIPMCATSVEAFVLSEGKDQDIYMAVPSAADIKLSDLTEQLVKTGFFKSFTGFSYTKGDQFILYSNHPVADFSSMKMRCRDKSGSYTWIKNTGLTASYNDQVIPAGSAIIFRKVASTDSSTTRTNFKPPYIQ